MEEKKSFILYLDLQNVISDFNYEQKGKLLESMFLYQNGEQYITDDFAVNMLMKFLIPQFERDAKRWEEIKKIRAENGRKGGLQKALNKNLANTSNTKQHLANTSNTKQHLANLPNLADNVNVNVNDNVNVNVTNNNILCSAEAKQDKKSEQTNEIMEYLNKVTNSSFSPKSKANREHISARLSEGYTVEDFKLVIDFKNRAWGSNDKMKMYLRPATLFSGKFDGYLNEAKKDKQNYSYEDNLDDIF